MKNPNRFYTYAYLRENRTPYYIGKGQKDRAYYKYKGEIKPPKDKTRIIFLKQNLTEEEAFKHEKYMIVVFGRKDLGTGILRNKTDGGEGTSGLVPSEETKRKQSESMKGENNPNYGKSPSEETRIKLSKSNKGKSRSQETRRKQSKAKQNKKYWNDGNGNLVRSIECPGKGWFRGMGKMSEDLIRTGRESSCYGKLWWHDGNGNYIRSVECPGENWILGLDEEYKEKIGKGNRNKRWWNNGNGNTKFAEECPGEGWVAGRGRIKLK